jgi:hypothetical protein
MLIINQVMAELVRSAICISPKTVADMLDLPLWAWCPSRIRYYRHLLSRMTDIEGKGDVQDALKRIVRRLTGEDVPLP